MPCAVAIGGAICVLDWDWQFASTVLITVAGNQIPALNNVIFMYSTPKKRTPVIDKANASSSRGDVNKAAKPEDVAKKLALTGRVCTSSTGARTNGEIPFYGWWRPVAPSGGKVRLLVGGRRENLLLT